MRWTGASPLTMLVVTITVFSSLHYQVRGELQLHAPIFIDGNAAFTQGNGVVGGTGTRSDPYKIEGLEIDVSSSDHGVLIQNTDAHFVIRNMYVHSGPSYSTGIFIYRVVNGRIETSTVSNNGVGIRIESSANITLLGNIISQNQGGIWMRDSRSIGILANTFTLDGVLIAGEPELMNFDSHTITPDNMVNGKPLYFYKNCEGLNVDGVAVGQLILVSCKRIRVANLEIADTDAGIQLAFVDDALLTNNKIYGDRSGIRVQGSSSNVTIIDNDISRNDDGIVFINSYSDNAIVSSNLISSNRAGGVAVIEASVYGTVSGNNISNNGDGIFSVESGTHLNVTQNLISNNLYGMVSDADYGFDVHAYHNNFVNNGLEQVFTVDGSWDNDYPSGGNFWSDYKGKDNCSGPNQNICPSPDGIGDAPYTFFYDMDRYPLMGPAKLALPAGLDIEPGVINSRNAGRYLTSYIDVPEGFNPGKVDLHSILLNGTVRLAPGTPATVVDHDGDGKLELMVKFDLAEVRTLFLGPGVYALTLTGRMLIGTRPFEATDTIRLRTP